MGNLTVSFIPHLRQGMSTLIKNPATPTGNDEYAPLRSKVDMTFTLKGLTIAGNPEEIKRADNSSFVKSVELLSPVDIQTISPKAILKTDPVDGAGDFAPNFLPYIEFYDEDFPWRYSPIQIDESGGTEDTKKLTPWLTLVALKAGEFEFKGYNGTNQVIKITVDNVLPDSGSLWAWAHAQYNGNPTGADTGAKLDEVLQKINSNPDLTYSRIISPRKLEPETFYNLFLIPTFELGRLAGMGETEFSNLNNGQDPYNELTTLAWSGQNSLDKEFPVYHTWSFKTSTDGDFEALVKKLEPKTQEELDLPRRSLDIQDPGISNFRDTSTVKSLPLDPVLTTDVIESSEKQPELWPIPHNKARYLDRLGPKANAEKGYTEIIDETGVQRAPRGGRCWNFDGSSHILCQYGYPLIPSPDGGSFSLWFKTTSANLQYFLDGDSNSALYVFALTAGRIYLRSADSAYEASPAGTTYNDGTWHFAHVNVDFVAKTSTVFIDGNQIMVQNFGSGGMANLSLLTMGAGSSGQDKFDGSLKDIRMFDHLLIDEQVSTIQKGQALGTEHAWYLCEEEGGPLAMAKVGNDATILSSDFDTFHGQDNDAFFSYADVYGYTPAVINKGEELVYESLVSNAADADENWRLDTIARHTWDTTNKIALVKDLAEIDLSNADLSINITLDGTVHTQTFTEIQASPFRLGKWVEVSVVRSGDDFDITVNGITKTLTATGSVDIPSITFFADDTSAIYQYKWLRFMNLYTLEIIEPVHNGKQVWSGSEWTLSSTGQVADITVPFGANETEDLYQGGLVYQGRVAYNAQIVNNPCLNLDPNNATYLQFDTPIHIQEGSTYTFKTTWYGYDNTSAQHQTLAGKNGSDNYFIGLYQDSFTVRLGTTYYIETTGLDLGTITDFAIEASIQNADSTANTCEVTLALRDVNTGALLAYHTFTDVASTGFINAEGSTSTQSLHFLFSSYQNSAKRLPTGQFERFQILINTELKHDYVFMNNENKQFDVVGGNHTTIISANASLAIAHTHNRHSHKAEYGYSKYSSGTDSYYVPNDFDRKTVEITPDAGYTLDHKYTNSKYLPSGEFDVTYGIGLTGRTTAEITDVTTGTAMGSNDDFGLDENGNMSQVNINLPFSGFNPYVDILAGWLNANGNYRANETSDEPELTPPLYGQWYANLSKLDADKDDWFHRINLDPRYRYISGLGRSIVREHQSEFMDLAWEQAEEIIEINKGIVRTEAARRTNKSAQDRTVSAKEDGDYMAFTGPLHVQVDSGNGNGDTVFQLNQTSNLPSSIFSGVSLRMSSKGGLLDRNLSIPSGTQFSLTTAIDQFATLQLEAEPPYSTPTGIDQLVSLTQPDLVPTHVSTVVPQRPTFMLTEVDSPWVSPGSGGTDSTQGDEFRDALVDTNTILDGVTNWQADQPYPGYAVSDNANAVKSKFDTDQLYLDLLNEKVSYTNEDGNTVNLTSFHKLLVGPIIDTPVFDYLYNLNADTIVPGINQLPQNSISLFGTNQKTLEAVMLGMNDEMNREMQFHGFPATRRTTIFRRFWNSIPESDNPSEAQIEKLYSIKKVLNWKQGGNLQKLGLNAPSSYVNNDLLILAIKGDLLTKFPHTVVYAHKAKWKQTEGENDISLTRELDPAEDSKTPLFFAQAGNTLLLGFELNTEEVKGAHSSGEDDPGYFFVFEEAYGEVHFGMDDGDPVPPSSDLGFWDELHWSLATTGTGFIKLDSTVQVELKSYTGYSASKNLTDSFIDFDRNSADTAYSLYQKPVKLLVHANELL